MLDKLDKFLIDNVFQPVVDFSQRKPRWWTLQMGILQTILVALSGALFGWEWQVFLMLFGWPLHTLFVSISDEACSAHGSATGFRFVVLALFLVLGCFGTCLSIFVGSMTPERVLAQAACFVMLAFTYFAACRPPKPPVRRTSS